jgi:predicted regulator of Ras-like GTPase activity (Roadblock/LC7/MglB family)
VSAALVRPGAPAGADFGLLRSRVEAALAQAAARVAELRLAALATADGRYLAGWFAESRNGPRISAIVSSLLGICETAGRELAAGKCECAIVKTEQLNVIVVRIHALGRPLVLATAFANDLLLGAALHHGADLARQLVALLDGRA